MNAPRTALTLARALLCCEHARSEVFDPNGTTKQAVEICLDCGSYRIVAGEGPLARGNVVVVRNWKRPDAFKELTRDLLEHDKAVAAAVAHVGKCGTL